MKLTINEKLLKRRIKRPSVIYPILKTIVVKPNLKKWNVTIKEKIDVNNIKPPFIVIFNHLSRFDYVFVSMALKKHRLNFMVGYNEFYRAHLKLIFKLANSIPKKNFTSDYYALKNSKRVLENKGVVAFSPEGMSSIAGTNQPIVIGTGKYLKNCNVPVIYVNIKGAYLMAPKYSLDERIGKVDVVVEQIFSPEELNKLSPHEIEKIINQAFTHDEYLWNKTQKVKYQAIDFAKNIETYLYRCPNCLKEFQMFGKDNLVRCQACNNAFELNAYYDLISKDANSLVFETPSLWFSWQRNLIKKELIDNLNFKLEEEVDLGMLPKYKYLNKDQTSNIVGRGLLTLTHQGLSFEGIKDNQDYSFFIKSVDLPTYGMCTDMSRFYTFVEGEFHEFYPKTKSVAKWLLATEEIHRLNGGKWQAIKNETT